MPMEILKPSPPNSSPLTTLVFLERAATIYGDCKSVIYNDHSYTWSETHRRCLQLASALVSHGIKRGQVVSVLAPNITAMYELHFAVPMAGAVLNTINTRLDARTISVIITHSESKLVFVDCASRVLFLQAMSLLPPNSQRPHLVLITDDVVEPSLSSAWANDFIDTYEGLMKKGDPDVEWVRPNTDFDPMILNYTSGTTSSPKGVVHCHKGIYNVTVDSLVEWSVPKQPVYLWTLPMFHANGWSFPWGMAAVGGTNICLRKFDGPIVFSLIERHGVTHLCGAPVVLNMLANSLEKTKKLQAPVKVITAGAPPAAAILFRAESIGFEVTHGYGLTETAGLAICCSWKQQWDRLPPPERARLKARQGVRTNGMTEIDVVDPNTGLSVKRDGSTFGEIVLRGASVMLGYLKDPEATAKAMKNGWFYTGDVAVMHPDGYVEIRDRSKDVIISGGENISSVEVESMMFTHPAINEVAVVARSDPFWGETPCAFVSLRKKLQKKPTEKEIIEYCKSKLPRYMVPRTVIFMDELPKTSTGKVLKFVLRDIAKSIGQDRQVQASRL